MTIQENTDHGRGRVHRQQCGALFRRAQLERHGPRQSVQGGHGQEPALAARRHHLRFRARRHPRSGAYRQHPGGNQVRCDPASRRPGGGDHFGRRAAHRFRRQRARHVQHARRRAALQPGSGFRLRLHQQGLRQDRRRGVRAARGRYAYVDRPYGIGESEALDFLSPYGCSKGAADQYVLDFARIYQIPATSFRQSCIYGPRQFGVEDQGWVAWFAIAVNARAGHHHLRRRQAGARRAACR